jgi:hypothetical protein
VPSHTDTVRALEGKLLFWSVFPVLDFPIFEKFPQLSLSHWLCSVFLSYRCAPTHWQTLSCVVVVVGIVVVANFPRDALFFLVSLLDPLLRMYEIFHCCWDFVVLYCKNCSDVELAGFSRRRRRYVCRFCCI